MAAAARQEAEVEETGLRLGRCTAVLSPDALSLVPLQQRRGAASATRVYPVAMWLAVATPPLPKKEPFYGVSLHVAAPKGGAVGPPEEAHKIPLRKVCLELRFHARAEAEQWLTALQMRLDDMLAAETQRPKKLIVFVNPVSGKGLALKRFNAVQPLFRLAGVKIDTVVTERAQFVTDWVKDSPVDEIKAYDAVVVVGGDGMVNEAATGMLLREDGTKIVIGAIPAGSTDALVVSTVGVSDPETSALLIIMGNTVPVDCCEIQSSRAHETTSLMFSPPRFACNFAGYGFFGDVIAASQKTCCKGAARYDWAGFKTFVKGRSYNVKLRYKPAFPPNAEPARTLCAGGGTCCDKRFQSVAPDAEWVEVDQQFKVVNMALMSLRCDKSPQGMAPNAHIGDGCMELITVARCGRLSYLRFLTRLAGSGDQFGLSQASVQSVTEVELTSEGRASTWNVDGEYVSEANLKFKLLPRVLTILGRKVASGGDVAQKETHTRVLQV